MRALVMMFTAWLVLALPAHARQIDPRDTIISLPSYADARGEHAWMIADSEWGYITAFNRALAAMLSTCPQGQEFAAIIGAFPTTYGEPSIAALRAANECGLIDTPTQPGAVSLATWMRVTQQETSPTVFDRAKAIVFRRSPDTPDYSHVLWNLDRRSYRDSIFTWGPMHATLGRGCTARRVLQELVRNEQTRPLIEAAFDSERGTLDQIVAEGACQRMMEIINPVYRDDARQQIFSDAFLILAGSRQVRTAYDLANLRPRQTQLRKYYDIYRAAARTPSEVDFAFVLEHALLTVPAEEGWARLDSLRAAASARQFASNADLRAFIAREYLAPSRRWVREPGPRSFLRGRITAYYIGVLPADAVAGEEMSDWIGHSRVRASDVGLSDEREFSPCEYTNNAPNCTPLFQQGA
jgi:hypothetical protein